MPAVRLPEFLRQMNAYTLLKFAVALYPPKVWYDIKQAQNASKSSDD